MPLSDLPYWFVSLTVISVGLCFGSFLNVVIYRLPRGLNVAYPASACPGCSSEIAAYDNIPVLSWLILRGKARCCKTPISPRYPLIELLGGLLAWSIFEARIAPEYDELFVSRALLLFALYFALGLALLALAFIDLEFMILPDSLTLGGAALGFLSAGLRPDFGYVDSAVGALVGFFGIWLPFIWGYEKLRGTAGMGLGDAKLILLAGAWFGWFGVLFTLFAGALQGTVAALLQILLRGKIEEPAAVTAEREELRQAIEQAEGAEREELEQILREDPLGEEAGTGLLRARLAFGPFLSLALIELLLFEEILRSWFLLYGALG